MKKALVKHWLHKNDMGINNPILVENYEPVYTVKSVDQLRTEALALARELVDIARALENSGLTKKARSSVMQAAQRFLERWGT